MHSSYYERLGRSHSTVLDNPFIHHNYDSNKRTCNFH